MALFYNAGWAPFVGGQQPYAAGPLEPPISGPTAAVFVPSAVAATLATLLATWPAASQAQPSVSPALIMSAPTPPRPRVQSTPLPVLVSWQSQPVWPQPTQDFVTPPISGPQPSPAIFTRVENQTEVYNAWIPPPPLPILPVLLNPPRGAVSATLPPTVNPEVISYIYDTAWRASVPPPQPSQTPGLTPPLPGPTPVPPPFVSTALQNTFQAWWPPQPMQPEVAPLRIPPPDRQAPGPRVQPVAVLPAWLPPPPRPITAVLLQPPIPAPPPNPVLMHAPRSQGIAFVPPPPPPQPTQGTHISPPISGPAAPPTPVPSTPGHAQVVIVH